MHKQQINTVSGSSSILNALGAMIGILWHGLLNVQTAQVSELSAKIRYDIGEDDVRPQTDHGRGEASLDAMLRRSI